MLLKQMTKLSRKSKSTSLKIEYDFIVKSSFNFLKGFFNLYCIFNLYCNFPKSVVILKYK